MLAGHQCYSLLNVAHSLTALHYLNDHGYFGNAANDSPGDHLDGGHSPTDYRVVNHLILLTVALELLILIKSVGFANLIHFAALAQRANLTRAFRFMQLLLLSIFTTNLLTVLLGATDLR